MMDRQEMVRRAGAALAAVRRTHPLVHNITNYVVMNSTANVLLSLGASPVMAHAVEEVEEMVRLAGALVLNIGTLSGGWIEAMYRAGRAAKAAGIPVVLDPVGAGATRLRTDTAVGLMDAVRPDIVRGNASEILAVGRCASATRGVDSAHGVAVAEETALGIAAGQGCVVAVTGPVDFVTDGKRVVRVANGHPLMGRVTGTGCAATAVIGAMAAVEKDRLAATAAGLVVFGLAGELAAAGSPRPGTYGIRLIDALDEVQAEHVERDGRVEVEGAKR